MILEADQQQQGSQFSGQSGCPLVGQPCESIVKDDQTGELGRMAGVMGPSCRCLFKKPAEIPAAPPAPVNQGVASGAQPTPPS